MATDARYRTKYFLDYYWTPENATDDNGNALGKEVMYAYPEYSLELEFKAPSVVDVIIAVDQPDSTPAMDAVTQAPYAYDERVPIEITVTDKIDVTATKVMWQAEAEVRRILETYPTGSMRRLERMTPATRRLGSTTLWTAKYVWHYRRDKSA